MAQLRWFWAGCAGEFALIGVAFGLSALTGQSLLESIRWSWADALLGATASVPLLALFYLMLRSSWPPLAGIRFALEKVVRPIFGQWSIAQLGVISLAAGLGEELLFRGAIQNSLTPAFGSVIAIAASSFLFGMCHALTGAYAMIAGLIGMAMSGLLSWTGNLLTPIATHAVYDFLALVYFLRFYKPTGR